MANKVITEELCKRHAAVCFNCGALFTSDDENSKCPECGEYWDTRWITSSRSWLRPVKTGLLTNR